MADTGGQRRVERFTPFVYLACTFALVAFALPSVLRPPPDQATTSAEFSPDAPPDAPVVRISGAGLNESHVHDDTITREPPNYRGGV